MFIKRDSENKIVALYKNSQFEGHEELPDNHEDVLIFMQFAQIYPTETILQDVDTGEPVKVMVKSGEVYVGGNQ